MEHRVVVFSGAHHAREDVDFDHEHESWKKFKIIVKEIEKKKLNISKIAK